MTDPIQAAVPTLPSKHAHPVRDTAEDASVAAMREAARAFEAAFLAEMLDHAGVGQPPEAFGGGEGEAQFAGLLREAQARNMAEAGGIGLAEVVFRAMTGRPSGDG